MDRDQLAEWLDAGLSLSEIGRRTGKDPSTVGYWVSRHGLEANGRAKYAPRGGLDLSAFERAVDAGKTHRELAQEFGCSTSTIQYWLRRHGLKTLRCRGRVDVDGDGNAIGQCRTHGATAFVLEGRGYYRCRACRKERVADWRRRAKLSLVDEAGGRCRVCGYDRYSGALHFHHLDPAAKKFGLAKGGFTRSIEEMREEAAKCVLLCSNCHAEVEAGIATLPTEVNEGAYLI